MVNSWASPGADPSSRRSLTTPRTRRSMASTMRWHLIRRGAVSGVSFAFAGLMKNELGYVRCVLGWPLHKIWVVVLTCCVSRWAKARKSCLMSVWYSCYVESRTQSSRRRPSAGSQHSTDFPTPLQFAHQKSRMYYNGLSHEEATKTHINGIHSKSLLSPFQAIDSHHHPKTGPTQAA